jgi:hypothetical protein
VSKEPSLEFQEAFKKAAAAFKEADSGKYTMALVMFEKFERVGDLLHAEGLTVMGTGDPDMNDFTVVTAAKVIVENEPDCLIQNFGVN